MLIMALCSGLTAVVFCAVLGRKKFTWEYYLLAFIIAAVISTLIRLLLKAIFE